MLPMVKKPLKQVRNGVRNTSKRAVRLAKKAQASAFGRYLAGRFDEQRVLILTSSPRSGSTLLGQVLAAIPNTCTLFEPLNLASVPEAERAGFSWRTYVASNKRWPEGEAFLRQVFEGRVCLLYTSPSPRDRTRSRMPSSA